jgi:hypothetical protein
MTEAKTMAPKRSNQRAGLQVLCILATVVSTGSSALGADSIRITSPEIDTIVLGEVRIEGLVGDERAQVTLRVDGREYPVSQSYPRWWSDLPDLKVGTHEVVASYPGRNGPVEASSVFVRGKYFQRQDQQKVRFFWNDVDGELARIAQGTLATPPPSLPEFVAGVKRRTEELYFDAFRGVAKVVKSKTDDSDVHTVEFNKSDGGSSFTKYGETVYDPGNLVPKQTSSVYVGTFVYQLVDDDDRRVKREAIHPDRSEAEAQFWDPMTSKDSHETRLEDLAQLLARTAVHETAHGLGLVGSKPVDPLSPDDPLAWMEGAPGNHDDPLRDLLFVGNRDGLRRFNRGRFIMDPGEETKSHTRMGEPNETERSRVRSPGRFNRMNVSYLNQLLPLR